MNAPSRPPGPFRLEIVGPLRLLGADGVEVSSTASKPLALLVYVILEGPCRRDDVARLLWPDVSDRSARHSLRQALSALRRLLGDEPFDGTQTLSPRPNLVRVDLEEFLDRCADGDAGRASDLVRGRVLSGLWGVAGLGFDEWLEKLEGSVLERYAAALEGPATDALARADDSTFELMVDRGKRLGLDPAVLRSSLGGGDVLPRWTTAQSSVSALEAFVLRLRPESSPSLALMASERGAGVGVARAVLEELPTTSRPALIEIDGDAAGSLLARMLTALVALPGGAAVHDVTAELDDRLQANPDTRPSPEQLVHAIGDALDAVLAEGPLLLSIQEAAIDQTTSSILTTALERIDAEGLAVIVHAPEPAKLQGEAIRRLAAAFGPVELIDHRRPPETPGSSPPAKPTPGSRRPLALAGILASIVVSGVALAGLPGNDVQPSVPGFDVLLCSTRSGTAQYYRWRAEGEVIERFSAEPSDGCGGGFLSPSGDSVFLAHVSGNDLRWLGYAADGPLRSDRTGALLLTESLSGAPGQTRALVGMRGHPAGFATARVEASLGRLWTRGTQYPWVVTVQNPDTRNSDLHRLNLVTGRSEQVAASNLSEGGPWLLGDTAFFARGSFGIWEDGSLDLFMKDLRTGVEVRLTENDWNDYQLAVSPDGSHLCWQSEAQGHYESEIWVMDLESRRSWNLSDSEGRDEGCEWSPDSRVVVWESWARGSKDVVLRDRDGGERLFVSPHPAEDRFTTFIPVSR